MECKNYKILMDNQIQHTAARVIDQKDQGKLKKLISNVKIPAWHP